MSGYGPCDPWPVRWQCDTAAISDARLDEYQRAATEFLWAASGRRFGTCTLTYRPCRRECVTPGWVEWTWTQSGWATWPHPALIGGLWYNLTCGSCIGSCECRELEVALMPENVLQVVEVRLDGSPLVSGGYDVQRGRELVRTDGKAWPACQRMELPDTQPNTWSVRATFGREVPTLGELAAGELACQFVRAATGEDCRLPPGVTQLVRQGVSITFPDLNELARQRRTGLFSVDAFLDAVNPYRLDQPSAVYRVDHLVGGRME